MNKHGKKGIAIGAVIGAVAGVVAGILFAPKSGKETRKDIKDVASKTSAKLKEEAVKLVNEAKDFIKETEAKIAKKKNIAREKAQKYLDEFQKTIKNLKTVINAVKEGSANDEDLDKAIKESKQAYKALKDFLKK
ncbi:YtxH domain-containing protein [Candidatus Saccharibacteria bacterium]|nr:YtxH domain-containing protein [Candidatus Saccharibacteria bacterium]